MANWLTCKQYQVDILPGLTLIVLLYKVSMEVYISNVKKSKMIEDYKEDVYKKSHFAPVDTKYVILDFLFCSKLLILSLFIKIYLHQSSRHFPAHTNVELHYCSSLKAWFQLVYHRDP